MPYNSTEFLAPLCIAIRLLLPIQVSASDSTTLKSNPINSTTAPISTTQQALDYLNSTPLPDTSAWWPNIRRNLFLENLRANLLASYRLYHGTNTNFCGYA